MSRPRTAAGLAAGRPRPYVVVGMDASDPARRALRWADSYASLAGGTVTAVAALPGFEPSSDDSAAAIRSIERKLHSAEADALARCDAVVREVLGGDVTRVVTAALAGGVADVLLEAASDADLLVVGSTPKGALGRALIGTSPLGRLSMAPCPVVLVRSGA